MVVAVRVLLARVVGAVMGEGVTAPRLRLVVAMLEATLRRVAMGVAPEWTDPLPMVRRQPRRRQRQHQGVAAV